MKLQSQLNRIVVAAGLAFLAGGVWAAPVISAPVTDTSGQLSVNPNGLPAQARGAFEGTFVGGSKKTDGFSSYALTPLNPNAVPPNTQSSVNMSSIGAELTTIGGGGRIVNSTTDAGNGRFDTTGGDTTGQWWLTGYSFSLTFERDTVSAFGFYGTDFGDFSGSFEIELYRKATDTTAAATRSIATGGSSGGTMPANNGANNAWLQFYSIFDDQDIAFERVVFRITQDPNLTDPDDYDFLGFDDFVVGRYNASTGGTVPEPGSLALVGASLLGLAAARRRKPRA